MSERDDADGSAIRRKPAGWVWPATTFVLISAFMFAVGYARDAAPRSAEPGVAAAGPAERVNTRAWRTIAADPAAHAAERVVLWGQVTAFDPAADPSTFRADVDAARHNPRGGTVNYPTAVVLHGDPATLRPLAEGYIFKAEVTVDGAVAPEAGHPGAGPAGGALPVGTPRLTVTGLTVTDKTVG